MLNIPAMLTGRKKKKNKNKQGQHDNRLQSTPGSSNKSSSFAAASKRRAGAQISRQDSFEGADASSSNRGKKLRKLRTKLLRAAPGWSEAKWGFQDVAVFIDWCSLFQEPRD